MRERLKDNPTASIIIGGVAAIVLIYGSLSIQGDVFGTPEDAWFPLRNPGLVSDPASFAVAIVISWGERLFGRATPIVEKSFGWCRASEPVAGRQG